jgi:tetratricopeptide (TPR) repeat protein
VGRKGKTKKTRAASGGKAGLRSGVGSRFGLFMPQVILIAAGSLAYISSFKGVFLFDDLDIQKNPYIQHLWPPWSSLFAPPNISRPLLGLTLAINHAAGGFDVWGYHALNLTIHLLAGLALFGVVRRTLLGPRLKERFGPSSSGLALAIALIWLLHPLQTESVTYIIQRCEALMGLFYLVTLYCVVRGADSEKDRLWYTTAVFACLGGMLCKQVMITAPIVVLIYDFLFLSGSVREVLQKRGRLYGGLALTWGVLAATTIAAPRNATAGFAVASITPWDYLKSEFGVIVYYIRLAIYPDSLCLDYGWPKATNVSRILASGLMVLGLAGATIWALIRRKPIAFLGVWFFGILSLTSSFMPFADLAFEHRMYLPLAALVALIVLGGYVLGGLLPAKVSRQRPPGWHPGKPLAVAIIGMVTIGLFSLTVLRNSDYDSGIAMWADVVKKRPGNVRAHNNLGELLAKQGELDRASTEFSEALQINPEYAQAQQNLGMVFIQQGKLDDGIAHLSRAVEIDPSAYEAYTRLGAALANQRRIEEAIAAFSKALAIQPDYGPALANLGFAQERDGKTEDAIASLNAALPRVAGADLSARVHFGLGNLSSARGETQDAIAHYREVLRLKPDFVPAQQRLKQISQ